MNFLSKIISPRENIPPKLKLSRSPQWSKLRTQFLKQFPQCSACGSKKYLEVHHILPVWLRPDLELDKQNLITLCENKSIFCHFVIGHSFSWLAYNPHVREDANLLQERIKNRSHK